MDTPRSTSRRCQGERTTRYVTAALSAFVMMVVAPALIQASITEFTQGQVTLTLAGALSTVPLRSGSFNDYAGSPHPAGSGYVTLKFCSNENCTGPGNLSVEMEIIKLGDPPFVQSVRVQGPGTSFAYLKKGGCSLRVVRFSDKGVEGSCTCEGPNESKVPMGGPLSALTFTARP